ncbi:type IX secretion system periplasmic lipoprotein PorW/SprE [Epilithonimonas mollis]|uniref:Protein involved in gliding motility SprE n=1 Tax=Epilithonimonas mollis TaxID=216903 RepID=A0A1M6R4G5_9FLAO|nr:tetratricopeptide repeat protein [Epilithonimonas mollis]SHK27342.1 protein involved in gliding motility SprE [Epilithonimonas mollis]
MKKYLLIILAVVSVIACNPRTKKKKTKSGPVNRFLTFHNTLFNSKESFLAEMENRDKTHVDNFYDPYIAVYTTEDNLSELQTGTSFGNQGNAPDPDAPPSFRGNPRTAQNSSPNAGNKKGATTLQITEAKALKAISKYSVLVNGVEKNKKIFEAYMLLAKARMYQGKHLESLDALGYIFNTMSKDKRLPLARIYQAANYTKMKEYYRADEVFKELEDDPKIKLTKEQKRILKVYQADNFLKWGKKEIAAEVLEDAFTYNNNRKTKSRIAFLRGQILAGLGQKSEARESFAAAYKYANSYEFEVKSQIEIAKTFDGKADSYEEAIAYIEKIAKKGTYASRKNELYYASGLIATNATKDSIADSYFRKALKEKQSDPQIRGLTYSEIAKKYFAKDDYLTAGVYYDSALAVMSYKPEKDRLTDLTANIKKLSKNYYIVKKNDSILALTKMSDAEKRDYFTKYIDKIKEKEAVAELEKKRAERSKGFDNSDYNANSIFANNPTDGNSFQNFGINTGGSSFYFANSNNIPRGENAFKQLWGNRTLQDNWRYSAKTTTIEDLKNEALGITSAPDPRRLEPEFYIEKIPTSKAELDKLKKDRDTASLGMGRMYETFFGNTKLATKTLYDLVENKPHEETDLMALYNIFVFNYEKNPADAEKAKQLILEKYPYTSYAEFVKNPKNKDFNKSTEDVEKLYAESYKLYLNEKYAESAAMIDKAITDNPKDALIPKFYLLNAYNAGKTAGKEIMILQLEQIVLNYKNTPEGKKAQELLKFLKSDAKLELTDETGKAVTQQENQKVLPTDDGTEIEEKMNASAPIGFGPGKPGSGEASGQQTTTATQQMQMQRREKK